MRIKIGSQTYTVRFRHTTLPGADCRRPPTRFEVVKTLLVAVNALDQFQTTLPTHRGLALVDLAESLLQGLIDDFCFVSHSTECYILDEQGRLVSSGITFCDKRDQFCRAIGRWHAFLGAVSAFPKTQQRDFLHWLVDSPMAVPASAFEYLDEIDREELRPAC